MIKQIEPEAAALRGTCIEPYELYNASIAISLKRIADAMTPDRDTPF